jgi:hypothetical protein
MQLSNRIGSWRAAARCADDTHKWLTLLGYLLRCGALARASVRITPIKQKIKYNQILSVFRLRRYTLWFIAMRLLQAPTSEYGGHA